MLNTDVLIIGGSASGLATATAGKSFYPEKKFLVVRKEEKLMVPCGIPYIFGTLDCSDKNVMPTDVAYDKMGIDYKVGEVTDLNFEDKKCTLKDGQEIQFDKVVIATGSTPTIPKWLKGADLENVFTIPKNKVYLDNMQEKLKELKKVVVIGAGFIGVEIADELNKRGYDVTIVELLPQILSLAFDKELAVEAEKILTERGVKIDTGSGIKELIGENGIVKKAILQNGETIDTDAVILSIGYAPNVELAKKSGALIRSNGFIAVDEYMRVSHQKDIFAVGDCAEKRDFVTRHLSGVMLASTACAEGRIAGMNLYKLSAIKTFSGTIAIYSTCIGDNAFGTAGLTEKQAVDAGFDVVTGTFEGIDRHPGNLPDKSRQIIKLVVAKETGIIIGGMAMGGKSIGELINLIGFIVQNKTSIHTLLTAQIGTHPLLTASPAQYPLLKAAEMVVKKMR